MHPPPTFCAPCSAQLSSGEFVRYPTSTQYLPLQFKLLLKKTRHLRFSSVHPSPTHPMIIRGEVHSVHRGSASPAPLGGRPLSLPPPISTSKRNLGPHHLNRQTGGTTYRRRAPRTATTARILLLLASSSTRPHAGFTNHDGDMFPPPFPRALPPTIACLPLQGQQKRGASKPPFPDGTRRS